MTNASSRIQELSENERKLLAALADGATLTVAEAAAATGMDDVHVRSAGSWLAAKGFVESSEVVARGVELSEEGRRYAEVGLPERRLWVALKDGQGMELDSARRAAGLDVSEIGIALAWWQRKGLGRIEKAPSGRIVVADPKAPAETPDERALDALRQRDGADDAAKVAGPGLEMLRQRKGLVVERETKNASYRLVAGVNVDRQQLSAAEAAIDQITPEILKSGSWRGRRVRPFDVKTPAPRATPGKPHPLVQIIQEVRELFLEMGFAEIEYDYVQSTFWNMDALFIPQDHPAREMQDTFYLEHPANVPVPKKTVDTVAKVHVTGGGTGSRGWGGVYDKDEAARALLRTHTTVGTIRHLAAHPDEPCRVFSVGRVFRKETMDATHLPEFHQVEGIATEPGANFRQLLGILKEFYRRLGFEKLRWRPAYFPYTEPSMEVEVFRNGRWMELGGAGIFRPEVTQPLGVKNPVLAWGLGLERLAMMRLGITDIRGLYVSDLEWLRNRPLL